MTKAEEYARALFTALKENPRQGERFARNLKESLKRRGWEKLLPAVAAECRKLALAEERAARYRQETPEGRRTKRLLELYERLVRS